MSNGFPLIAVGITFILNGITACIRETYVIGVFEIVAGCVIIVSGIMSSIYP